ncbi:MAG: hypothetical protein O7C98_05885 [Planctomycetota bacterium]|nr:hypothetical protein [Planctomycetota bacterium]
MRTVLVLCLLASLVWAAPSDPAERFPSGAIAYMEARNLSGLADEVAESALGRALQDHPQWKEMLRSKKGLQMLGGEAILKAQTGHNFKDLLQTLAARQTAVAVYVSPTSPEPRVIVATHVDVQRFKQLLDGVARMTNVEPRILEVGVDQRTVLWTFGDFAYYFLEGDMLFASTEEDLVRAAYNRPEQNLAGLKSLQEARAAGPRRDRLFLFVDLQKIPLPPAEGAKAEDLGQALFLGALPRHVLQAPWAAISLSVKADEAGGLELEIDGRVPKGTIPEEMKKAYGASLRPLPFALPERTIAVSRFSFDLKETFAEREALIMEKALPGLTNFESVFQTISGGLSFVEEFLPATGTGLTLVAARQRFEDLAKPPEVKYPDFALLLPLTDTEAVAPGIQGAFYNIIGIVNVQLGQKGQKGFLQGSREYKGVTVHAARYYKPTEGEMEGRELLPPRYNFSPATAIVKDTLVLASTERMIKDLIDGLEGQDTAPPSAYMQFEIRAQAAEALQDNREVLVADSMLKQGLDRKTAEARFDGWMRALRTLRKLELVVDEKNEATGFRFRIQTGPEGS